MSRNHRDNQALNIIAQALSSMAHSFAIIAANTAGITPEQKAAIEKVTGDLKVSHDRLQAAVEAAGIDAKAAPQKKKGD
jgi:hypothetical protein